MPSQRNNYCCGRPLFSCNKALNKLWYEGCGFSRTNDACADCRQSTVDLERCLFSECGLHIAMKHRKIKIGPKRDWINFLRFIHVYGNYHLFVFKTVEIARQAEEATNSHPYTQRYDQLRMMQADQILSDAAKEKWSNGIPVIMSKPQHRLLVDTIGEEDPEYAVVSKRSALLEAAKIVDKETPEDEDVTAVVEVPVPASETLITAKKSVLSPCSKFRSSLAKKCLRLACDASETC